MKKNTFTALRTVHVCNTLCSCFFGDVLFPRSYSLYCHYGAYV